MPGSIVSLFEDAEQARDEPNCRNNSDSYTVFTSFKYNKPPETV